MKTDFGFDRHEWAALRRLASPGKIQRFLDEEVAYNKEKDGETCRSPRQVLRDRLAHCAEGAYFAAAALRVHGHPPLILDLAAVRDDDHVLAVYKAHGCWGAIAKSNYSGLRFREPVYRTLRELVMSYYAHYYNLRGELTLRAFSTRPVNLTRFDKRNWMTSEEDLFYISDHLCVVAHTDLLVHEISRQRRQLDRRLFEAGLVGSSQ
ncbi:MAG: hypothetical protein SF339_24420 [Blastocatellia bacterium]|nr:hypothetical protein [Blastocatellia bacterium]